MRVNLDILKSIVFSWESNDEFFHLMATEALIIRTSISSEVIKHVLFRGFSIAFLGMLGLLLGTIFIPVSTMKIWGLSLFLMSLGLVTLGLLPYRRLSRLQLKPNEIALVDTDHLTYYSKGRKILTIPLQSVAKMSYIQHPLHYGIAVWLKPSPLSPVIVHQCPKEVKSLRQKGKYIEEAHLFLPYFNQRAYHELLEWQEEENDLTTTF